VAEQPNILFIFSDQQHWEAVGFRDASFRTPNLDRLASESTVFENAFCTTPQCSPSRASMLTGLYPSKTGVIGNVGMAGGDPLRTETVGAMLQKAGYRTGYFGKWHLGKERAGVAGWDEDLGVTGPETRGDAEVTRRALDFLSRNGKDGPPFALFLSYDNPHDVYLYRKETNPAPVGPVALPETWHEKDLSTTPPVQRQFMAEDQGRHIAGAEPQAWQWYRKFYREKVRLYDREVGRVLGALDDLGLVEETLVVATSDHGDMDGQQGLILKGPFMYDHLVRVPLMIRLPAGLRAARVPPTSEFLSSNVDLVPTLMDFALGGVQNTDGVSLRPFLTGDGTVPQRGEVIGQYYSKQQWVNPIRMIRTHRHKYNLYRVHGEELYDLEDDPCEIHNVADDPRYQGTKADLANALEEWMQEHDDPFHGQDPSTRAGEPLLDFGGKA
jgi:arylsulfatase A-like enzyme